MIAVTDTRTGGEPCQGQRVRLDWLLNYSHDDFQHLDAPEWIAVGSTIRSSMIAAVLRGV